MHERNELTGVDIRSTTLILFPLSFLTDEQQCRSTIINRQAFTQRQVLSNVKSSKLERGCLKDPDI